MKKLLRLFWEFCKISLVVVGGGYAIIVVADEVFGKKLKWLQEGELLDHLPVFQMIPGLIAGNTAIYTGLKVAGRLGAVVALAAVALPSIVIFLGVSCGYAFLPTENPWVESALLGLRSALTGVIFGTLIKGWRRSVVGWYGYVTVVLASLLLIVFGVNVVAVLVTAMLVGVVWAYCGGATPSRDDDSCGVELPPLSRVQKAFLIMVSLVALSVLTVFCGRIFWTFLKFGLLGFGGGYVLVPIYMQEFVGETAPLLRLHAEEFSNLMALTQITPGPVSVNAATFFGYRLSTAGMDQEISAFLFYARGVIGGVLATTALLLPSLFLLTIALTGIEKWKKSRFVRGLLFGVKPATNALILKAGVAFIGMSVLTLSAEPVFTVLSFPVHSCSIHPFSIVLALFAGWMLVMGRLSIMATIFLCAVFGALGHTATLLA